MKKIAIFLAVAALAIGCQKNNEEPKITLSSPAEVVVANNGSTEEITFTSNVAWTASCADKDWVSLTPTSGEAGAAGIKASFLKNPTEDDRSTTVTIKGEGASVKVKFTQTAKNVLSLATSEKEIDCNEQTVDVTVLANVEYTVTPSVDWIEVKETKAPSHTTTLAVKLNQGEAREGKVTFAAGELKGEFTVKQGAFVAKFEVIGAGEANTFFVERTGGKVSFSIDANVEFKTKRYDVVDGEPGVFAWAPIAIDGANYTFDVQENNAYDPREAYIKFTIPAIQDPVFDDNGDPTGETQDRVVKVYVSQMGYTTAAWDVPTTAEIACPSTHTIAKFGDKIYVANALSSKLFAFDAATGAAAEAVELPIDVLGYVNSIAADDAGNLVIAFGGNYPLEDGAVYIPLQIYAIPAGKTVSVENAVKILEYTNGFYGYGLDNMKVTGDVTGDAAITLVSAIGSADGSYAASWQITGGKFNGEGYSKATVLPTEAPVWYSGDMVAIHSTNNVDNGLFYIGYGGHYDLCYTPDTDANWAHVWASGSTWAENYSAADVVEWNGSKYIVILGNAFFQHWGMPSYLSVLNIDNPAEPVQISQIEIYHDDGVVYNVDYVNETTADVCAVVENGDLAVYLFDMGTGNIAKVMYPVIK